MSEVMAETGAEASVDTVDRLTGGAGAAMKAGRPAVWAALEASEQALLGADAIADISPVERRLVALAVASWHEDAVSAHVQAAAAAEAGASAEAVERARAGEAVEGDRRLAAMLAHARMLTFEPAAASRLDLDRLRAASVSENGIISLSQLIAYLSHQLRAAHLLRILGN